MNESIRDKSRTDGRVASEEVTELLRRVGNGEAVPKYKSKGDRWEHGGVVPFVVDDWEVVVFSKLGDFHYIDSVVAPDGRQGDFDDWVATDDGPSNQPDDMLSLLDRDCFLRMVRRFENVQQAVNDD